MKRYLFKHIKKDLKEKMVFIGGPRQVGKTTLAFEFLKRGDEDHPAYLTWDFPESRPALVRGYLPANEKLIILDEIHKYKGWRNLVKGLYDKNRKKKSFLITGSAKLDYYRRGGDSLQGRYYYYRLHPLSLRELSKKPKASHTEQLLQFGGFPEPCLKANTTFWRRWQRERVKRVIQEDVVLLENVKEIDSLGLLAQMLPERVGSPLSIKGLREDLNVAHETADKWVRILENLYYCFRILPYGPDKIRAVKKERKLYLWDWSLCEQKGARFENLVGSHLLKYCHFVEDTEGYNMDLRFIRDVDKRELDFIVLKEGKPLFAVECKTGDKNLSKQIKYFAARTPIPKFYQVHLGKTYVEDVDNRTVILPFHRFCEDLMIP